MKVTRILTLIVCSAVIGATPAFAAALGDRAAPLKAGTWLKGDAVDVLADEGVYVVEFWATWCPPCRTSIPHLTELQKKHKKKGVTIIGISDETEETVRPFLTSQGDAMDYHVMLDPNNAVAAQYMGAFGVNGIPHAFVVQKGKIAWHGHPMAGLDEVLDAMVAGTYDMEAASRKEAEAKLAQQVMPVLREYFGLLHREKVDDAIVAKARELANRIMRDGVKSARLMNVLAWGIIEAPDLAHRDLELALRAAEAANKAAKGEDPSVLDTYARVLFKQGQVDRAIEVQQAAVEKVGDVPEAQQFRERLEEYELTKAEGPRSIE